MEQSGSHMEDFTVNVASVTLGSPGPADVQVSDDDKAGATLLFSGVFLGLVGITFTAMGWIKYQGVSHFEWTQLLGPILLSVGVTFVLIAVCKFNMLLCQSRPDREERLGEADPTPGGPAFVFTGINQPITFHGATVVQYIPPPYAPTAAARHLPLGPLATPGAPAPAPSPPQYYAIYPQDNAAFVDDDEASWPSMLLAPGDGRSSPVASQLEEAPPEDSWTYCYSPPPYEEIYTVPHRD
ncbi:transmembrane protein 174 [Ornithorhynchus anatinus]|uniref:Transmembrane protein 174 n=1 Tax=Ornithorhynchus anatinus TaxID=9258 RepID=A0A6I8NCN4_ORNAN|nr:transmembrane protein 174 [Ornithorhynchus anatinus]